MNGDGSNITQLGVSTLFEGHAALLNDGRILYDRWEYVDRNFGDAQGLWVVNPDGTKHAIYYGNNTASPGGVIDARAIPNSDQVVCIFGSCHDKAWGAIKGWMVKNHLYRFGLGTVKSGLGMEILIPSKIWMFFMKIHIH